MSSTFTSYRIAVSGMYANQTALTVVTSNIANVDTEGYSRKIVSNTEQVVSRSATTTSGSGVTVVAIRRARDTFLDQSYRQKNATASYWETKTTNLTSLQETLNEFAVTDGTANNGLQQAFTDFFNSWAELSKDPSSQANRQSVVENAQTMLSTLQDIEEQLVQLQEDSVAAVQTGVATLNGLAEQVAAVNGQIAQAELSGAEAGDLRDQRDNLLDQMSALTNLKVTENANGMVEVSIGGVSLVTGTTARALKTVGNGTVENPLQVQWTDLGVEAAITNGSVFAHLEDADQSGVTAVASFPSDFTASLDSSVANLRQGLNVLFTTIATAINDLQTSGYDLDGNAGVAFFVAVDSSQALSLSNVQINPALDDVDLVVASSTGSSGDGSVAEQIYDLMSDETLFKFEGLTSDLTGFYQSLVSWVATAGANADGYYETQSALVQQVDNQRQAVSSVSLDEEMAKMIAYQSAYNACAKVLTTVDSLIANMIEDWG